MWEVIYTKNSIEVSYDDGNDVWLKTIPYEEVYEGISKAIKEDE